MARGTIVTRVQKDGTKRYAAVLRINRKQVWRTFEKFGEAEDYLDRNSTDVRDGTYREIRPASFKQYAEHWKQTHAIVEKHEGLHTEFVSFRP